MVRGFRAEKRKKLVRVLAARRATSLKKWPEFRRTGKQKGFYELSKLTQFSPQVATFSHQ